MFAFEFIEGNTITRIQFLRTLRRSFKALEGGNGLTEDIRQDARSLPGQIAHFLDLPMVVVIVYCGTLRPESWSVVFSAIGIALVVTAFLVVFVPRLARYTR